MQSLIVAGLVSISLTVSAVGAPADLEWSAHYENAKAQAAAKQRPLLVVVEDSSDPDGKFKADEFASKAEQIALLKNYELCRMDVNTAYGKKVADAFQAKTFPMTVVTDRSANFIAYRADGEMALTTWESMLATKSATDGVRVETSKIITEYPATSSPSQTMQYPAYRSVPSNCPNCIRNQQRIYYYQ